MNAKLLIASGAVLAGAVALQWAPVRDIKEGDRATPARAIGLAESLPRTITGWQGRDEPLGTTENVRNAVERTLNYDDYVFRLFSRSGASVGMYVAYWSPGRLPVQKVASHTPDRCWTENGWSCPEQRFDVSLTADGKALRPAQWRRFVPPGNGAAPQYVLYWHLVGRGQYDYGKRFNARPDMMKWWRDTIDYAFRGSDDQYFIRLTSDRPFEEIWTDPGFQQVIDALRKLGLEASGG